MVDMPVEIFLSFIGFSIALAIFGFLRQPQIPAMLAFGGMFILTMVAVTDNLDMGNLVSQSEHDIITDTTTYTYIEDLEPFTDINKVLFAFLGVIFILGGALMIGRQ